MEILRAFRWDDSLKTGHVEPEEDAAWDSIEEAIETVAGQHNKSGNDKQINEVKLHIEEKSGKHVYAHGKEYSEISSSFKITPEMHPSHQNHSSHKDNYNRLVKAVKDLWV